MRKDNKETAFCLECWGDFAFFGNSIYGANRQSYEIPTPSAVIGIFESVYWKPCFKWVPDQIQILNPIKYISIMRNELRSKMYGVRDTVYHIDLVRNGDAERVQRCDKILKDVRYRFVAHIDYDPSKETAPGSGFHKHTTMFERRARAGQCFHQPFFGSKEFPAFFRWVDLNDPKEMLKESDLYEPKQLGIMHYGFDRSEFGKSPVHLDYIPRVYGRRVFITRQPGSGQEIKPYRAYIGKKGENA